MPRIESSFPSGSTGTHTDGPEAFADHKEDMIPVSQCQIRDASVRKNSSQKHVPGGKVRYGSGIRRDTGVLASMRPDRDPRRILVNPKKAFGEDNHVADQARKAKAPAVSRARV